MRLDCAPLLRTQRELHDIPLDMDRFREYLRTIWAGSDADGELIPMLLMNPMGKAHVADLLDALIAIDAEGSPHARLRKSPNASLMNRASARSPWWLPTT